MLIETFEISCSMGRAKTKDWEKLGLTLEQMVFLNDIGYKGSTEMRFTREGYLNYIHRNKHSYKILTLKGNNAEYTEDLLVIRTSIDPDNLTKSEAYLAMKDGKVVSHRYFGSDEYLYMKDGKMYSGEGYRFDRPEGWAARWGDSWETGWYIKNDVVIK